MSKHSVPASDVSGLLRRFAELRRKAAARTGMLVQPQQAATVCELDLVKHDIRS